MIALLVYRMQSGVTAAYRNGVCTVGDRAPLSTPREGMAALNGALDALSAGGALRGASLRRRCGSAGFVGGF